ncbi:MAG: acetyl-CoA C-acyltransferase [Acidobacteria bacterium]|nr:MAG: acetyl-CoA C-acyltransferase [Acidobacteriota bacterium]
MKDILIVSGKRTPMAEYGGALRDVSALELGAIAARGAIQQSKLAPTEFDHAIFGNALQTSGDALYGARHVALKAGLPIEAPALTVNRLCGSGMQSIIAAAQLIELGEATVVLAGGMESMSQAPHVIRGARWGFKLGQGKLEDSLMVALLDTYCGCSMATTAENLGRKYGITREAQDEFAVRSQRLAQSAWEAGRFRDEVTPVETFERDDHMRPDTTLEGLSKLKPAFSKDGFVTAGNASGIVDGGAAVVVTTADRAKTAALGRIVSWGIAGVQPELMGIGPVPAARIALDKASLKLADIDLIEINEAFAAQYLAVEKALELDRNKVNVNGGAIALGHPLGASGTRLTMTVLYELKRRKKRFGLAAACIGGGQGIAIIVEAL